MEKDKLPESEVKVKKSICGKCNGVVRIAVSHMMDRKSKNEFAKEVMEYNLSVQEQPLIEFRNSDVKYCNCK